MSSPIQHRALLDAIKKLLKARGMTYSSLAKELGMSESGVKKFFSAKDCSLQRADSICNVLGVSLLDLLLELDQSGFSKVQFTRKQQALFLDQPDHFKLFWKLAFERITVSEAGSAMNLSSKEMFRMLRAIDRTGLIKLLPGGKIKIPKLRRVTHFGDGPLIEKTVPRMVRSLDE